MKKAKIFMVAAITLFVAGSSLFAHDGKSNRHSRHDDFVPPYPPCQPVEFNEKDLPDAATVKKYHDAVYESYKMLLAAKVQAGIMTQEWADASLAILKAKQADCKGECILQKRDDIMPPFPMDFHQHRPHYGRDWNHRMPAPETEHHTMPHVEKE